MRSIFLGINQFALLEVARVMVIVMVMVMVMVRVRVKVMMYD